MFPSSVFDALRRVRVPTYYVLSFLLVAPIIESLVSTWPLQIHQPLWRITLVTSVANNSATILLALLFFFVVGTLVEDRPAVVLVAAIGLFATVLCVFCLGLFSLDALQLRSQVRPDLADRFELSSLWGLARIGLVGLGMLILAVSAIRGVRKMNEVRVAETGGQFVIVTSKGGPERSPTKR